MLKPKVQTGLPAATLFLLLSGPLLHAQDQPEDMMARGARIYQQQCVSCHGDRGQGVPDEYDEPLTGTKSLEQLTKKIDRTMPEDDPSKCDGEDAVAVSKYVFDEFYSAEAQARNNPERFALSRLTVPQYRNSVLDLLNRFREVWDQPVVEDQGLQARYSAVHQMEKRQRFEKVDARIDFDFGEGRPEGENMDGDGFAIDWNGSLFVPETGIYEFIVKTHNGVRLFVNDHQDPVIDAMVSVGAEAREERKSVFLLGGRAYPLRIEYLTFKQKHSSIQLRWKPPHGVDEVIPTDFLCKRGASERMVVTTTFPADDRSDGYERGTNISKEWERASTEAALEVVEYVDKFLENLAGAKPDQPEYKDKVRAFAHRFVEVAFRRPLTDEEKQFFVDTHFESAPSVELAMKRVVLLALKSPRFLYPGLDGNPENPDSYDVAERLALVLWDSLPDKDLAQKAAEGKLTNPHEIAAQCDRMLRDPRAKQKLHGFFHHWLELDRAEQIAKDKTLFPEFDEQLLHSMRESLFAFIDQVMWSDSSDYRQLIGADYLLLDHRLGKFYGKDVQGDHFQQVNSDGQRAGLLTHPYLLASFAYNTTTSPIHRGVFLTRNIVGMQLRSPPVAVAFEDSKFDPSMTMREKVAELTKDNACMSCHSVINPLGFALENYDAVGRWREVDNQKKVDPSGEIVTDDGATVKFSGPRDIAAFAAANPSSHRAFIRQLFHYLTKQPAGAYGASTLEDLRTSFESNQFSMRGMIRQIALVSACDHLPGTETLFPERAARNSAPPAPADAHQNSIAQSPH